MRPNELYRCLILTLLANHKASYYKILESDRFKFVLDWIISKTPKLSGFKLGTRVCWVLHGYTDFPKCKIDGNYISIWLHKDIPATHEYPNYCAKHAHCNEESVKKIQNTLKNKPRSHWDNALKKRKATCKRKYGCEFIGQDENVKSQIISTMLKRFGVKRYSQLNEWKEKTIQSNTKRFGKKWYSQTKEYKSSYTKTIQTKYGKDYVNAFEVPECMAKANGKRYKKYLYDGIYFDSMPEIAFFVWLTDHNIEFEFHPKTCFTYTLSNGKVKRYCPDFYIKPIGKFIEIKGEQFFDKAGNFIDPYDKSHPEIAKAKFKCMVKNKVLIYRQKQYRKYVSYVEKTYGKDYLRSFRL